MAKEKNSPYIPGKRTSCWLKIKNFNEIDAVICRYTEGKRRKSFGSLILGIYYEGNLVPIGQVGTGFSEEEEEEFLFKIFVSEKLEKSFFQLTINQREKFSGVKLK